MISPTASAAAALALLAAVAAPAPQAVDPSLNSKNYSITQNVINNTSQTLSVTEEDVDNGATIDPHPQSVAPGGTLTIVARNHGNGVQLWLTVVTDNGVSIVSDIDVPKVNQNFMAAQVGHHAADGSAYRIHSYGLGGGNNPTASYELVDLSACSQHCYTSFGPRLHNPFA